MLFCSTCERETRGQDVPESAVQLCSIVSANLKGELQCKDGW